MLSRLQSASFCSLVLVLGAASACDVAPGDATGEVVASRQDEIRNGFVVEPWAAGNPPNPAQAVVSLGNCTGTIIDPYWILTAKHCGLGVGGSVTNIRPGTPENRTAVRVIDNPSLDVTIAQLDRPITDVPHVPLFVGTTDALRDRWVDIYGYGAMYSSGRECTRDSQCVTGESCNTAWGMCMKWDGQLRMATVHTQSRSFAQWGGDHEFKLDANGYGQINMAGDSGGPVFYQGRLAGVYVRTHTPDLDRSTAISVPAMRLWAMPYIRQHELMVKRSQTDWLGAFVRFEDYLTGGAAFYENGQIYYTDSTATTSTLYGLNYAKWLAKQFLGYPITDEVDTYHRDGRYNHFEHGTIYYKWGASESFEVHGCNRQTMFALGFEWGNLGWPTSDEYARGSDQREENFENGRIYYRSSSAPSCLYASWPVLTRNVRSPRLAEHRWPEITSASLVSNALGAQLVVSGRDFTPGAQVSFYVNNPDYMAGVTLTATVRADGTFSADQRVSGSYIGHGDLRRVNGYVTVEAIDSSYRAAVIAVSTSAGNPYLGSL